MARTGGRARSLAAVLVAAGWTQTPPPTSRGVRHQPAHVQDRVREVYAVLGGAADQFDAARPGGWDMAFDRPDGTSLVVELDEEQHFNRYRLATLQSAALTDAGLPWGEEYATYCVDHEHRLLPGWGRGKRWTSTSSERFFGPAQPPGDFTGVGSPRWRQRAFYDACKDLDPAVRLARISIYDSLDSGGTLETRLRSYAAGATGADSGDARSALVTLLNRRTREPGAR